MSTMLPLKSVSKDVASCTRKGPAMHMVLEALPGNHKFHPFDRVCSISSLSNDPRIHPDICQLFQVATRLKHFDWHRKVDKVNVACQKFLPSLHMPDGMAMQLSNVGCSLPTYIKR